MEERLNIPPTKSALLELERRVRFLHEGYRLLEHKRELLTRLVYENLQRYRTLKKGALETLRGAYESLSITQMRMGSARIRQLALGMPLGLEVSLLPRRNMGVQYPSVTIEPLPLQPVGILGTDASLDETRLRFAEMAEKMAHLAEVETALLRLLEEQRKTQKRVNALKYNVIPRFERTIRFVRGSLEEEERNTLFQIKVLLEQENSGY
jgi:V/A-type H+-transporting ATPase subunit D